MTVFGTRAPDQEGDVLKVRNPNITYRMELAFGFMQKIVDRLVEKDPVKYAALPVAIADIKEWIMHDIRDEGFLKKDAEFRARHDGFRVGRSRYSIRVPISKGPDSEYIKRESFALGRNLTAWKELEAAGHDMKAIVSLMTKSYFKQLTVPVNEEGVYRLHADIHPGNFRVDEQGNLWILDRNGYHDYDQQDMALIMSIQIAKGIGDIQTALIHYFSEENEPETVQRVIESQFEGVTQFNAELVRRVITSLRLQGVKVPLKITMLLKNMNALNRFAVKAGFEGGLVEALFAA